MLKQGTVLTRPARRAKTRRSAGKATTSEEARRTLRYVEPMSDARTAPADFQHPAMAKNDLAEYSNDTGGEQ
jgi:hypothetical protein